MKLAMVILDSRCRYGVVMGETVKEIKRQIRNLTTKLHKIQAKDDEKRLNDARKKYVGKILKEIVYYPDAEGDLAGAEINLIFVERVRSFDPLHLRIDGQVICVSYHGNDVSNTCTQSGMGGGMRLRSETNYAFFLNTGNCIVSRRVANDMINDAMQRINNSIQAFFNAKV